MSKYIKINDKNLYGLAQYLRDKRLQWQADQDYVDALVIQLESDDKVKASEAAEALLFLNAFNSGTLDGNFAELEALGVEVSPEFKAKVYDSRNSAQRDLVSCASIEPEPLHDFVSIDEGNSISELADGVKQLKRKLRKSGKSIKTERQRQQQLYKKSEQPPLPVKTFSKEEIKELETSYLKNGGKKK